MERKQPSRGPAKAILAFDAQAFLDSAGIAKTIRHYARGETIFTQGDDCQDVLYIQTGGVKLSVLSKSGREAVVAVIGPGDFFGEECLAGQPARMGNATAITPCRILLVGKDKMLQLLHQQRAMSDRFISHMLSKSIRIEGDFVDHLFSSSEKRLARALLLLAQYGKEGTPARVLPKISQARLADMLGVTRARVKFLVEKFKRLGYIECDGPVPQKMRSSLLTVVLRD